jgi:hypothetical protein
MAAMVAIRRAIVPASRRRSAVPFAWRRPTPAGAIVPIAARSRSTIVIAAADHHARRRATVISVSVAGIVIDTRRIAAPVSRRVGIGRTAAQKRGGRGKQETSNCGFHDLGVIQWSVTD